MSKASIEKEMNSPSEQSEEGDQFRITMQKFMIPQKDKTGRQRSQLKMPEGNKQTIQGDNVRDIFEEEEEEKQQIKL